MVDDYVIFNNMAIYAVDSIEQLSEMSPIQQIANPITIANFAFEHEMDVLQYLHRPSAFEAWLYSESSLRQLPREIQEGLGDILGSKYSLENRLSEIEKRTQVQSNQVIDEDVGYVFDSESMGR
jgi:hypothetical protein